MTTALSEPVSGNRALKFQSVRSTPRAADAFSLKTSVEGKGEDAMKLGHSTEGVHSPAT